MEHIAWLRHTTSERWIREGKHHANFCQKRDARRAKPVDQSLFCSVRLCKGAGRHGRHKRLGGLVEKSAPKIENLCVARLPPSRLQPGPHWWPKRSTKPWKINTTVRLDFSGT